jgi:predicted DNA binding protein
MWKVKIRLKHRCVFGDNCSKAGVTCVNVSFNTFRKGRSYHTYHFGTVFGENSKKFISLLQKDRRVDYIEVDGNTFLMVEKRPVRETPGAFVSPEIVYIKPVLVDSDGWETWEVAAINQETLMGFIRHFEKCEIVYIERTKLRDIYFPRLGPQLTRPQRDALELAQKCGYYAFPKKTDLNRLSKRARLSKSAYREHLRRAEAKVLGDLG